MSYGAELRRYVPASAGYVDKILRGAKARRLAGRAADQVRTGHQSKRTAKILGIEVSPALLATADEIIE